ncbi:MAG: metallophosphatase family protein [Actinomycetota bacterium]|nr:metallophosphatase family protein [Actinomycetota bacterium]
MRIAVVSDTHMPRGRRRLPDECLRNLAAADLVLHGGDVVTAGVLEELAQLAPVQAVQGNMDEAALRDALPARRVVEAEGVRIGLIHVPGPARGRHERLAAAFPDCDAVVYGHTHTPELTRHGDVWMFNPGSPTERRRSPARSMLVLEVRGGVVQPELVELGA